METSPPATRTEHDPAPLRTYGARGGGFKKAIPPAGPAALPSDVQAGETEVAHEQLPRLPQDVGLAAGGSALSASFLIMADIKGFVGACLMDSESGLVLASRSSGTLDMEAVAALGAEVVKAEREAIEALDEEDALEDILVTMGQQLHIIHVLERAATLFLYVVLDRSAASLGMARIQIKRAEGLLTA